MRKRLITVAAGVAAITLASAGAAVAAAHGGIIPDGNGIIHTCYSTSTGALRVIDSATGQGCASTEKALSWPKPGYQIEECDAQPNPPMNNPLCTNENPGAEPVGPVILHCPPGKLAISAGFLGLAPGIASAAPLLDMAPLFDSTGSGYEFLSSGAGDYRVYVTCANPSNPVVPQPSPHAHR